MAASRAQLKEKDFEKAKEVVREKKAASRAKQREKDDEKTKECEREKNKNRMALSRRKRKVENHQKLKNNQNAWQEKHRRVENANDRLKEFREVTMYNAVFICTCCHQRMFQSNVCIFTAIHENNINNKKPGHIAACIERGIPTQINGEENCYICKTCLRHMQNKKMPQCQQ